MWEKNEAGSVSSRQTAETHSNKDNCYAIVTHSTDL